jgi:hypothetical protein
MSERMGARDGAYTFLDRHPESVLLPLAAFFGFTAYLNIAAVVASRRSVGAAWLPSVLVGAVVGVAVLAAIVARFRAGKVGWSSMTPMVLVIVGLLTTKKAVWAVPYPPGLATRPSCPLRAAVTSAIDIVTSGKSLSRPAWGRCTDVYSFILFHTSLAGRALARPDGSRLMLQWNDSQVTVMGAGPDLAADAALLWPLARALEARVYKESGALLSADA